ncbi:engulfment and cell motility protein 1-like [Neodiprion virginianus]|uniref:engulfment and cell motility protein 1-like n=1 Tax=Neodiprion virginianus TaxID=2961670 RepID=UPI001EE715CC|nr:engulfment and cell motility protein 1-like [Neodiprion virginianus]
MPDSIVSVAVAIGNDQTLVKMDRSLPLDEIIADLCVNHGLIGECHKYALQIARPSPKAEDQTISNRYVTPELISQVLDGTELRLVFSAATTVRLLFEVITDERGSKRKSALQKLANACEDPEFARCFVEVEGPSLIVEKLKVAAAGEITAALACLRLSMQHGYLDQLCHVGIDRVVAEIAGPGESEALREALLIACLVIARSEPEHGERLRAALTTTEILTLVKGRSPGVQLAVLGLVNAILLSSESPRREEDLKALADSQWRQLIFRHVLGSGQRNAGDELAHQLHVLQTMLLNSILGQSQETLVENDDENGKIPSFWRRVSTETILESVESMPSTPELSRQGSTITLDEATQTYMPSMPLPSPKPPPTLKRYFSYMSDSSNDTISHLTPNCLEYFSQKYHDSFVLAKEEAELLSDLNHVAQNVVDVLCTVLRVGTSHERTSTRYCPLFFSARDAFFEELFCHAIWTLGKTMRDLRTREPEDHLIALRVLHRQLKDALDARPTTLSALAENLKETSAAHVQELWAAERQAKFENLLQRHPAIDDLRNDIRPKAARLVTLQRLNALKAGHKFSKHFDTLKAQKAKNWWFVHLSDDERVLIYGDWDSESQPYSNLHKRISVASATGLATGKRCPHAKGRKYPTDKTFFSLLHEGGSLDFIAPNKEIYNLWTDGLTALLGRPVLSAAFHEDVDMIVDMEVRLRLLDLGDAPTPVPMDPPPLPSPPANYEFCDESLV